MSTEMATQTGAYVADALPPAEREEFEQHLQECADCAREVQGLRETVARLGVDVAASPPEELKQRVLDEIARTRQQKPSVEESSPEEVRRLRTRRSAARRWGTRLAIAAAALGVALAAAFGGFAWHAQNQLAERNEQVQQESAAKARMARMLQEPDARIVQGRAGEGTGTAVVAGGSGQAMFLGSDMPSLPAERAYQLWYMTDAGPVPAGMVPRKEEDGTRSVMMSDVPSDARQMAMTVEPAGGSEQPTTDPIMLMDMPA